MTDKEENTILRELLWLNHGHQGLYGDDGEMQCGICRLDFKRDPVSVILDEFKRAALGKLAIAFQKDKIEKEKTNAS